MSADLTIRPLSGAPAIGDVALESKPFRTKSAPDAAQKFEAFVMQSFIQEMMPKQTEQVFGSGIAGDFWKSLLSEKIAEQVAERGSLGISNLIKAKGGAEAAAAALPQTPAPLDVISRLPGLGAAQAAALDGLSKTGD